jgi:hypothetical protein
VFAAITFGANLLHLVNTLPLYGQRWDAAIDRNSKTSHRRLPGTGLATFPAPLAGRSGTTGSSRSVAMSSRRSG